jgi:primary-amine oxidase
LAPFHDHFFNFRLDFDIDGVDNDFRKAKIAPMNMANVSIPRTSMWGVVYEDIETEIAARTKVNPSTPCNYFFVNRNQKSGVGYAPGYELMPM